jgi:hypothetical protein
MAADWSTWNAHARYFWHEVEDAALVVSAAQMLRAGAATALTSSDDKKGWSAAPRVACYLWAAKFHATLRPPPRAGGRPEGSVNGVAGAIPEVVLASPAPPVVLSPPVALSAAALAGVLVMAAIRIQAAVRARQAPPPTRCPLHGAAVGTTTAETRPVLAADVRVSPRSPAPPSSAVVVPSPGDGALGWARAAVEEHMREVLTVARVRRTVTVFAVVLIQRRVQAWRARRRGRRRAGGQLRAVELALLLRLAAGARSTRRDAPPQPRRGAGDLARSDLSGSSWGVPR